MLALGKQRGYEGLLIGSLKDHAGSSNEACWACGLVELFLSLKIWRSVLPELAQAWPRPLSPQPPLESAVLVALEEEAEV